MKQILRDALKWVGLVAVTLILWAADLYFPSTYLERSVITLFTISLIYLGLRVVFENITLSRISEIKTKYSFRKGITVVYYLLIAVVVVIVWVQNSQAVLVSFGIIGAGLAIALQDVFRNFAGSIFIISSGLYSVGDRIEIDKKMGDVIDIGLWNTTLMEIQGWVNGDQPSGRITLVPNGLVITTPVFNYTKDFTFIWDEITIPLTYQSDWKEAISVFSAIAEKHTAEMIVDAQRSIEQVGTRYYFIKKSVEPSVYLTTTSNWIEVTVRYVSDVRRRRQVHNELSRKMLAAVEESEVMEIGSSTMIVTGRHQVTLQKEDVEIERP